MSGNRKPAGAETVAFPAVLGAVSLVMLYGACLMPTGIWGWTAVAGLGPLAVVASRNVKMGFLCWAGVSILSLLLLPDKFCAFLFTILFGLYPMVKSLAERVRVSALAYGIKLCFFNAALTVILLLAKTLMMASLPDVLAKQPLGLLYLLGNVVFLVYEIGLTRLIRFYLIRVDRVIRKNGRFE